MMKRLFAWAAVLMIGYAAVTLAGSWSSPWEMPASPVLSMLPAPGDGCGKDCK